MHFYFVWFHFVVWKLAKICCSVKSCSIGIISTSLLLCLKRGGKSNKKKLASAIGKRLCICRPALCSPTQTEKGGRNKSEEKEAFYIVLFSAENLVVVFWLWCASPVTSVLLVVLVVARLGTPHFHIEHSADRLNPRRHSSMVLPLLPLLSR